MACGDIDGRENGAGSDYEYYEMREIAGNADADDVPGWVNWLLDWLVDWLIDWLVD